MSRRSAALVGRGRGPAVWVRRAPAVLQLRGLLEGEKAHAFLYGEDGEELEVAEFHENCDAVLQSCFSVVILYEGKSRYFSACVKMGRLDALESA